MKVKVRRLKRKSWFCLIVTILVMITLIGLPVYFSSDVYKLKTIGYNSQEIKEINSKKLKVETKEILLANKYIKNLSNILKEKSFDEEKVEYYIEFYKRFNDEYDSNILEIINEEYFKIRNLDRYVYYYKNNKDFSSREIVENVNCGLDKEYYTVDNDADLSKDNLVLVNKYNKLSEKYVPDNLVKIKKEHGYERSIDKTAYEAFQKMYNALAKEKLYIFITSPYRSYKYQNSLYNKYVKENGKEEADSFSARAGYSEHQTGLAIDIAAKNDIYTKFANTKEYEWMLKNCHKYGFVLRYPEGKEKQTGYMFESWHYRYVGVEVATYIYENNITFDEYYECFLK